MGKIRTRKVKTLAKSIFEMTGDKVSLSFEENKKLVGSLLYGRVSKRLRNRVAGYLTSLAKQYERKRQAEEATQATEGVTETEGNA